jgi:hypothetical protein
MTASLVALGVLLVVVVASRWLQRPSATGKVHVPWVGGIVLRPPRRNGFLLALVAIIPAITFGALGLRLWATGEASPAALALDGIATLACVIWIGWLVAGAFLRRIVANEVGLERFGVATRRLLRWEDVERCAYNGINRWFFLSGKGGVRIWIPEDHDGIGDFAELALRKLPRPVLEADAAAREALQDLAEEAREAAAEARKADGRAG